MSELRKLKFGAVENDITPYTAGDNTVTVNAANRTIAVNTSTIATKASVTALEDKAIPSGGSAGQVLKKKTATDYDMEWGNESGGGSAPLLVDIAYNSSNNTWSFNKTFTEISTAINDGRMVLAKTSSSSNYEYLLHEYVPGTSVSFAGRALNTTATGRSDIYNAFRLSSNNTVYKYEYGIANAFTGTAQLIPTYTYVLSNNGSYEYTDSPTGPFNVEWYTSINVGYSSAVMILSTLNSEQLPYVELRFGSVLNDPQSGNPDRFELYHLDKYEYSIVESTDSDWASWMSDYDLVCRLNYDFRTVSELNGSLIGKTVKIRTFADYYSEIDPDSDETYPYRTITYTVSPLSENWTFTLSDNSTVNKRVVVQP